MIHETNCLDVCLKILIPRTEIDRTNPWAGHTIGAFCCDKPQVIERENILHVFHYATPTHQPTKHAAYLAKWMRQEAEHYLNTRTLELEQQLCPPKPVTAVQFRKTKSKWGHCTSKGEIQLNWLLIMAPPDVMDYVMIHELCHLTHMNHSKAYWQLVAQFCPNYQQHKQWLNQHGHKISIIS